MTSTHRHDGLSDTKDGGSQAEQTVVRLPEGVAIDLLTAAVTDFARHNSIRMLVIKGPALVAQGLRGDRASSDVDVLIDPADFQRAWDLLHNAGWSDRDKAVLVELPSGGSVLAPHARTLEHGRWPCHLDLHRYYPGLLRPTQFVFDALWDARAPVVIAHAECWAPSTTDHWLIAALHAERSRDVAQLVDLVARAKNLVTGEMANLAERAEVLGAAGPLSDALAQLGVGRFVLSEEEERLTALWRRRLASDRTLPEALVEQFRGGTWPARIRLALRQLFPSPRFAQAFHGATSSPRSLAWFYLRRVATAPREITRVWASSRRGKH